MLDRGALVGLDESPGLGWLDGSSNRGRAVIREGQGLPYGHISECVRTDTFGKLYFYFIFFFLLVKLVTTCVSKLKFKLKFSAAAC